MDDENFPRLLPSFSSTLFDPVTAHFPRPALPRPPFVNPSCGGEGSCGTCLVAITQGMDLASPPARIEAKALAKQNRPTRWRWSCRAYVGTANRNGDVHVQLRPQVAFADEQAKTEGLGVP